jgi:hypothetical protein
MPTNMKRPKSARGRKPGLGVPTTIKIPPSLKDQARRAMLMLSFLEANSPKDFTAYVIRALERQIAEDEKQFERAGGKLPGE